MPDLTLTTCDWVPEPPRDHVRDLRVRGALEEAGLPSAAATTPFRDRGPDHLAHQSFAQVPSLTDGDRTIFESGAILLHLAATSEALSPADQAGHAAVVEWSLAVLNFAENISFVFRPPQRFGALEDFPASAPDMARATARPALVKAHADQLADFPAAEASAPAG